ncbi:MAG: T9SS type A sorting domain-containing protein [Ignavibacteria bacterium]
MRKVLLILLISYTLLNVSGFCQWVPVTNGMGNISVNTFTYKENNLFAGTGSYASNTYGVFLSTDFGSTWSQTSMNTNHVFSLAVIGNNIVAGTNLGGIYISTNNGISWSQTNFGNNRIVHDFEVTGNNIFAGTYAYGVYISVDNGVNWAPTTFNSGSIHSLGVLGNKIFAGEFNNILYSSTNNGTNWSQTALDNQYVLSLAVNNNCIYAGTAGNGIFISTNNGAAWDQTALNNLTVYTIAVSGNYIFAGCNSQRVYMSSNNGMNWIQKDEGITTLSSKVNSLYILNNYIYAGTEYYGVYRRPLNELIGIQPISNNIPETFSLSQNYPNPFNPTTKIRFDIRGNSATQTFLSVYDILGREVATLVKEELKPGTYEVNWDATNFVSGVYFYKLITQSYTETKKMILLK